MLSNKHFPLTFALILVFSLALTPFAQDSNEGEWISLFNGKNLDGWTPKFRHSELGENYKDTFRVEDGLLTVSYDKWEGPYNNRFGHIFYKDKFSHYRIRVEYRFIGEQAEDGPGWAFRNSGIMLHCQDPATMRVEQDFPVSIEAQLLGGDGENKRSTLNLCTPGTHVVYKGNLHKQHCTNSSSKTYHGDQWVTVECEVRGSEIIKHIIDGETVLEYTKPQWDESNADAKKLIEKTGETLVDEGYISLQAESHPIQFRKVELLPLED